MESEMRKQRDEWMSNREARRQPSKAVFWCDSCDAERVGHRGKCAECGAKSFSKQKAKKPIPVVLDLSG
jgi:hypothetical protein